MASEHWAQWCRNHKTKSLHALLEKVDNEALANAIVHVDNAAHGDIDDYLLNEQKAYNYLVKIVDELPGDAFETFAATFGEWIDLTLLFRKANTSDLSDYLCECVRRVHNAIRRLSPKFESRLIARVTGADQLKGLHSRYREGPTESVGAAIVHAVKQCTDPSDLEPFCSYFLEFATGLLAFPCQYKWGDEKPPEADITGHETEILWALTEKLPNQVRAAALRWKGDCHNEHLGTYVLWPWFISFGTTVEALWGVNQKVSLMSDLDEHLFGLRSRVERGQSTVIEILAQLRKWAEHAHRYVREGVAYSLGPLFCCQHTTDAEKRELLILHDEMVKSCDTDPEENRYIRTALSKSLVPMAGPP